MPESLAGRRSDRLARTSGQTRRVTLVGRAKPAYSYGMTDRARGLRGGLFSFVLLLSTALSLVALPVSSAGAASSVVPLTDTMGRLHLSVAQQSAVGRTVKLQTGLAPSQVAVGDACGAASTGHASCMA